MTHIVPPPPQHPTIPVEELRPRYAILQSRRESCELQHWCISIVIMSIFFSSCALGTSINFICDGFFQNFLPNNSRFFFINCDRKIPISKKTFKTTKSSFVTILSKTDFIKLRLIKLVKLRSYLNRLKVCSFTWSYSWPIS